MFLVIRESKIKPKFVKILKIVLQLWSITPLKIILVNRFKMKIVPFAVMLPFFVRNEIIIISTSCNCEHFLN